MRISYNTLFFFALVAGIIGPVVSLGGSFFRLHDIPFLFVLALAFANHKLFKIKFKWIFPLMIFFMLLSILHGYFNLNVQPAYHDFIRFPRYLIYWSAFFIGNNLTINKRFVEKLAIVCRWIVMIVFLVMLIQLFNTPVLEELVRKVYRQRVNLSFQGVGIYEDILHKRPYGPLGNANALNFVLIFILAVSLGVLSMGKYYNERARINSIISLIFCLLSVIITQSRTGFVMMLVVFSYIIYRSSKDFNFINVKKLMPFILIIFVGYSLHSEASDKLSRLIYAPEDSKNKSATIGRLVLWIPTFTKIKYSPILGWGPQRSYFSNMPEEVDWEDVPPQDFLGHILWYQNKINSDPVTVHYPHNGFLNVWVQFGLIGLLLVLALYRVAWKQSYLKSFNTYSDLNQYSYKRLTRSFFYSLIVFELTHGFWVITNIGTFACLIMGSMFSFKNDINKKLVT